MSIGGKGVATGVVGDYLDLTGSRNPAVLWAAAVMFLAITVARIIWVDAEQPIIVLQVLPVALVAMQFGRFAGLLAGAVAFVSWFLVEVLVPGGKLDSLDAFIRLFVLTGPGFVIGWLADLDRAYVVQLENSARDFRFIAEDSPDMISTHTPDGDYAFVSNACTPMLGYSPAELIGTSSYLLFHPDDTSTVEGSHSTTLLGVDVVRTTYRLRHAEGHYVWVETKSQTNRSELNGEVQSIQCVTRLASDDDKLRELARRDESATRERMDALIGGGGPEMVFQPILDIEHGVITAVEALSRFPGEHRIPPDVWFEDAWRVGRGLDLELLAIGRALAALDEIPPEWTVTVNASPLTVQSPRLIDVLGKAANRVIVELTEHASITDTEAFLEAVTKLKGAGTRLAIDDVGAGFAGLSRLLDLDPDLIKLDLAITREIDSDPKRQALTSAFVAFAEEAGIHLVAEGVETAGEEAALRERGVRLAQGYRFARPMAIEALLGPMATA